MSDKYGLTQAENMNIRIACCKAETGDGWGEVRSLRNHLGACIRREEELESLGRWVESLDSDDPNRQDEDIAALYAEWRLLRIARRKAGLFLGEPYEVVADAYEKAYDESGGRLGFGEFLQRLLS
ncbi:MAG: hypothetical protein ACYS7Y_04275 [Planctomycetota bacterium]|jgi:hypothetical protein